MCNSRLPTKEELPRCFNPDIGWGNGRCYLQIYQLLFYSVSLDEFLSCHHNLAFNRQTRMLADLSLVQCYNLRAMSRNDRDRLMLASAKSNLKNLAFFGLKERMNDSQELFEQTFNLR